MKKSFILYTSFWEPVKDLPREQKGELLEAIYRFQMDNKLIELSPAVKMAFAFIRSQFIRDAQKYDGIVEKRREAGRKGAEVTNSGKCRQMSANASKPRQSSANPADNVDDDVNDDVDVNEIHSGKSADIPGVCFQISGLIKKHCQNQNRVHKGNRNKSANTIRLMQSSDKIDLEQIKGTFIRYMQLYTGAQYDPQIFSAESLRDKWNKLIDFINRQDQAKATEPEKPAFKEFGGIES